MKLFYIILFLIISTCPYAQQSTANKITIIGVKHNGNKNMNGDSLLNILYKINPGIIFNESIFKKNASFFADKIGLNRAIEIVAPVKYLIKNPKTEQIQIDIKFKSLYHRWRYSRLLINLEKDLYKKIDEIFILKKTPDSIKYSIMKFRTPHNYFYNLIDTNNLYTLNQSFVVDSCRSRYSVYEHKLLPIINTYPAFSKMSKRANKEFTIWKKRNETMARNILNRIKDDTIKTPIVILCGLAHKFALEDLLKPEQEKYNFKLYDYWALYK